MFSESGGSLEGAEMQRTRLAILPTTLLGLFAATAHARVWFYVEPEGSANNAAAGFREAAGPLAEFDFEDPAFGPSGSEVPVLPLAGADLLLDAYDAGPYVPTVWNSREFDDPGRFENRALYVGSTVTIRFTGLHKLRSFGAWIFDDRRAYDAAYLVTVTERNGQTFAVRLENDRPLNAWGHEIEGFVGVISTAGLAEITITAIDPESGAAIPDEIELDHVMAGVWPVLPADAAGAWRSDDDEDSAPPRADDRRSTEPQESGSSDIPAEPGAANRNRRDSYRSR